MKPLGLATSSANHLVPSSTLKKALGACPSGFDCRTDTIMMVSVRQSNPEGHAPKAFFSVDDGTRWFADDVAKPSGFMKDGKPAYSVNVYARGSGKPFVGFLKKTGM